LKIAAAAVTMSVVAEDYLDGAAEPTDIVEAETVEGMPVLADVRPIEPAPPAPLPVVQAAAVAATGFVAGAATMALVRRHAARKLARSQGPVFRRGGEELPVAGPGRTFLVHVHMIGRPGA
jgi:hypothetical protein